MAHTQQESGRVMDMCTLAPSSSCWAAGRVQQGERRGFPGRRLLDMRAANTGWGGGGGRGTSEVREAPASHQAVSLPPSRMQGERGCNIRAYKS